MLPPVDPSVTETQLPMLPPVDPSVIETHPSTLPPIDPSVTETQPPMLPPVDPETLSSSMPVLPPVDSTETFSNLSPPSSSSSFFPLTPSPSRPPTNGNCQVLTDNEIIELPEKRNKIEDTGSGDGSRATLYNTEKGGAAVLQEKVIPSGSTETQLSPSDPTYGIQGDEVLVPGSSSFNPLAVTNKTEINSNNQMTHGSSSSGQSITVSSQPPASLQLPQVPDDKVTSPSGSSITNKVESDSAKVRAESSRPMIQSKLNREGVNPKEKSQEGTSSSVQLTMTKDEINKQMQMRKRKKETDTSLLTDQDELLTSKKPVIADSDKIDDKIQPLSVNTDDDSAAFDNSSISHSDNEAKLVTVSEESNNNNTSEDVSTKVTGSPEVSDIPVSSPAPHKLSLETTSSHLLGSGSEPNSDYSSSPPVVESQHQPNENNNTSGANPNNISSTTSESGSQVNIQNHSILNYDFVILI